MTGAGLDLKEVTHHPDTGARLIGAEVPNWAAMKATAVEGARLMHQVPMIGWDMAPGPDGAIIVEMNQTPDVFLHQLADARGLLEPEFLAFMAFQKQSCRRASARDSRRSRKIVRPHGRASVQMRCAAAA